MSSQKVFNAVVVFALVGIMALAAFRMSVLGEIENPQCPPQKECPSLPEKECPRINDTMTRDRRVLSDPLYPPLNRTSTTNDSFRLVGYLTSSSTTRDVGNNQWKLFARMKDRNVGEFYISPVDNNLDMKIPLNREVMSLTSERLRDVHSLPTELIFNSPLLNKTPYTVVELPKADLTVELRLD